MPDVLALPLAQAEVILKASGLQYQVRRIASGYRQKQTENCCLEEYVVRQQELSAGKLLLSTVMKRRKEVLRHGF